MSLTNSIYTGLPTTIFEVMSRLAVKHNAVNLGQGFPDVDGPVQLRQIAANALLDGPNQYPPMLGLPDTRQAIAENYKQYFNIGVDWQSQIIVTSGATEALSDCFNALIEPGDEVILLEPLYDCYAPLVERAGAKIKLVRLEPPNWELPLEQLRSAFSEQTKLVLLNNPMNPAGKMFTMEELNAIVGLCEEFDALIVADEVYEHLTFDQKTHIPILSIEAARNRAVAIGSAGKTFSMTGWKVGYVTGPPELIEPIAKAHQYTTFTTPPNLQKAVAAGLRFESAYFKTLQNELQAKRDRLSRSLTELGFEIGQCDAAYFVNADFSNLGIADDDVIACQKMVEEAGVAVVPVSAFYKGADAPKSFLRFCFCKQDDVLDEATNRLKAWLGS